MLFMNRIRTDISEYSIWVARQARLALLEEVYTSPKPGLVDPLTNGAHKDMNLLTFERSARTLEPFFEEMARYGIEMSHEPQKLFRMIRNVGIKAERAMYQACNGVNTHKGAIFTIGIFSAAAGCCYSDSGSFSLKDLIQAEQKMVKKILTMEIDGLQGLSPRSNGEWNLNRYGAAGVRGEAILGYPSVTELALPVIMAGAHRKLNWNRVKLQSLFTLMKHVEDGNVLARTGREGLLKVQDIAGRFLEGGGAYDRNAIEKLKVMDQYFTEKNYSNGGCADLLAAAIFLYRILEGNPFKGNAVCSRKTEQIRELVPETTWEFLHDCIEK